MILPQWQRVNELWYRFTAQDDAVTCDEKSVKTAGGVAHWLHNLSKVGHIFAKTVPYVWVKEKEKTTLATICSRHKLVGANGTTPGAGGFDGIV